MCCAVRDGEGPWHSLRCSVRTSRTPLYLVPMSGVFMVAKKGLYHPAGDTTSSVSGSIV